MKRLMAMILVLVTSVCHSVNAQVTTEPNFYYQVLNQSTMGIATGTIFAVQGYYTTGDGGSGLWTFNSGGCVAGVTWCVASKDIRAGLGNLDSRISGFSA